MYILNRADIISAENETIKNWLNTQKNKKKFRVELNHFKPSDFGIKVFEVKNFDRATQKLTELPILEDRIPKIKVSQSQIEHLREFELNTDLPIHRNLSKILLLTTVCLRKKKWMVC